MNLLSQLHRLVLCGAAALPLVGGAMIFTADDAQAQFVLRQERMRSSGISDRERERYRESVRSAERNRLRNIEISRRNWERDQRSLRENSRGATVRGSGSSSRSSRVSRGVTR